MTDFYTKKVIAIKDIDSMLSNNAPIEVIIYKITMKYGYSKKLVLERVQQLEDLQNLQDKTKEKVKNE